MHKLHLACIRFSLFRYKYNERLRLKLLGFNVIWKKQWVKSDFIKTFNIMTGEYDLIVIYFLAWRRR